MCMMLATILGLIMWESCGIFAMPKSLLFLLGILLITAFGSPVQLYLISLTNKNLVETNTIKPVRQVLPGGSD